MTFDDKIPEPRAPSYPRQIRAPCCKTSVGTSLPGRRKIEMLVELKATKLLWVSTRSPQFQNNILPPWQSGCASRGRTQSSGWRQSVALCVEKGGHFKFSSSFLSCVVMLSWLAWCCKRRLCPWTASCRTRGQELPQSHRLWSPGRKKQYFFFFRKSWSTLATMCSASSELSSNNLVAMSANVIRL